MLQEPKIKNIVKNVNLPKEFVATWERNDYFSIIMHSYYIEKIKLNNFLLLKVHKYFENMCKEGVVEGKIKERWEEVFDVLSLNNLDIVLTVNDSFQQLRSISPFTEVGVDQDIREELFNMVFKIPIKK